MLFLANFVAIFLILGSHAAVAHGDHWHHHGRGDHHDHNHGARDQIGYLRRLDNVGSHMNMPRHPDFVVGGKAYGSHDEFFQMGGKCRTQPRTPEEEDRANNDFKAWKEAKEKRLDKGFDAALGGRRLGVDWNTQTITVPVHFHVIHAGDAGGKYTYESDPSYIERSIKALNNGFRGVAGEFPPYPGRSYERYATTDADSNIRFCLAGTTTTDNADWYYADPWNATLTTMKEALHIGGSETMNVYVSSLGGAALGMATKPPNDSKRDGVVILNEVMPGGPLGTLSEGDTLTHEVGHWLGLMHTHDNPNGPCSGEGDYFMSFEASPSFGCDVTKDECQNDGGKNPIHDFMSYSDDDCMDQFTPGQNLRMQQAWETYRHKSGHSEAYSLAEDGVSCIYVPPPTSSPTTSEPTSSPTTLKPTTSSPTTLKPTTSTPTTSKPTTSKPTKLTGKIATHHYKNPYHVKAHHYKYHFHVNAHHYPYHVKAHHYKYPYHVKAHHYPYHVNAHHYKYPYHVKAHHYKYLYHVKAHHYKYHLPLLAKANSDLCPSVSTL
ncbi:hypothetical protein ACHAW5_007178 [Stephanodiscus triporus]|uniref:Peptidase M43 pregnancy-associated plasma-A domain-containing protein n=1 Tax=Stephanodiscus triporus TaxID=2934178 RepID=A0ABD3P031_9STRA